MVNSSFYNRLKNFGRLRIVESVDFIFSLLVLGGLALLAPDKLRLVDKEVVGIIINVSVALAAFIIAAFSILISFSDREFVIFLKELKVDSKKGITVYDNILFMFEWNIIIDLATVLLGFIIGYFIPLTLLYVALLFGFIYVIFSAVNLVSFITYFGVRKGDYEKARKEED